MKIRQQAPTTFTTDAHGQRLAHVAMANTSQRATLYAEDLERMIAAGWSPYWSLTNTGGRFLYVLARAANPSGRYRSVTVARLIAAPSKGFRVQYIDGDRCNLRRDDLRVVKGGGHAPTPAAALHPGTVEYVTVKRVKPKATERPRKASQHAPVTCEGRHLTPAEGEGCTTPAGHPAKPENPATCLVTARVPDAAPVEAMAVSAAESVAAFAHRVIDRAALSARVRQQVAQGNQR